MTNFELSLRQKKITEVATKIGNETRDVRQWYSKKEEKKGIRGIDRSISKKLFDCSRAQICSNLQRIILIHVFVLVVMRRLRHRQRRPPLRPLRHHLLLLLVERAEKNSISIISLRLH